MNLGPRRHKDTKLDIKGLRRKKEHEGYEEGTPLAFFSPLRSEGIKLCAVE
jgi:hypothetical protein